MFLDEPTTGFDPAARRAAWDTVRSLRSLGKTVLTNNGGRTLYSLSVEKHGRFICTGSCTSTWKPPTLERSFEHSAEKTCRLRH